MGTILTMSEPFDVYTDNVSYWTTHWGATLSFYLQTPPDQAPADADGRRERHLLGNVRLSNEHLKMLVFLMARTLDQEERRMHTSYDATDEILESANIKREEWNRFWGSL